MDNGVDTNDIAEKIALRTKERRAEEAKARAETLKTKQDNIANEAARVQNDAELKADKKAKMAVKQLKHEIEWKERTLYRL